MSGDWLSITDAAARLTALGDKVDRSSLSRYLKQHSEALPLRRSGRSSLVEFGALRGHRLENIRLVMKPGVTSEPLEGGLKRPDGPKEKTAVGGQARKVLADAELREMDLAERRRELTPTAEVDRAGREAVALMQSAFDRAVESSAAECAVKYGWPERTVRLALKGFARSGIEMFHREMLKRLDGMKKGRDESDLVTAIAAEVAVPRTN